MSVLEMCDPEAAAVSVEASVADAVRLMLDRHVGAVAIIDSQSRVAGIFTERDMLRKMALSGDDPAKKPVRDVMTTPVELATLATGPGEALAIMLERHFRHLAEKLDTNNKSVVAFLENLTDTAVKETKKNGVFVIPGLGRLVKAHRKARMGRNPQTGEPIQIKAKTVVKFRVAKATKDAIAPKK